MHIEYPQINWAVWTYWYFLARSHFASFLLERVTRKGLNPPPVLPRATAFLSLSHCVSLHPFANDLACLHIVTCSLPTHSSTVGRLAAHSPRPLHLIVPTLTWENREWCFSHSCWCTAWRINSSVGMAGLRSGPPLSPFWVSGAQSFLITGCRWGFTRSTGWIGADLPWAANWDVAQKYIWVVDGVQELFFCALHICVKGRLYFRNFLHSVGLGLLST